LARVIEDLSCYVLPGRANNPLEGVVQAVEGERIGLGAVWASERWETKETGALLGAVAQATSRIRLCAGTTHFGTRHPVVLAGLASTLQALSRGRFEMGVARSITAKWKSIGVPPQTNRSMIDSLGILRGLWNGERVSYSGPAGEFPKMRFSDLPETPIPVHLAAVGPKTLAVAGAHFDGVMLHPFLTPEGVARSTSIVRRSAEEAGRDPSDVRVIAAVVVAPDLSEEETTNAVFVRAATYFVHREMAMPILRANGWDVAQLEPLLNAGLAGLESRQISVEEMRAMMAEASAKIPSDWIGEGACIGSAPAVAARLRDYRSSGADEILLHGATADKLEGLAKAYRSLSSESSSQVQGRPVPT
jgi:5,10-methylenetetrahydromethanopterin reductase